MATAVPPPSSVPAQSFGTQPKVSFNGAVPSHVEDLLLWKDVKKSGIVFGAITLTFIALHWGTAGLKPLPTLLRLLAYAAVIAVVWATGAGFFGRAGPPIPAVFTEGFTEDSFSQLAQKARPHVNSVLGFLGKVLTGKNVKFSLQVAAGAYVAGAILSYLSLHVLLYIGAVLAFALPKLYELRKDDADKVFAQAQGKFNELYAKVDEAVLKKLPLGQKKVQ